MSDIQEIKALLQSRIHDLVRELAPDGHRSGAYWLARNPTRADNRAGSFWIRIAGSGVGVWADEATGDGAAQCPNGAFKGDVLGLVQYAGRLADVKAALAWSRDYLQLGAMPEADRRAALVTQRQQQAEAGDAVKLEKDRRRALALYIEAKKRPFLGSPADIYLRSRSIDIRALGRMPGVLGWLPDAWHTETRTKWPALLAGMQDADGRTIAIHRTFLAVDGSGKAPVEPQRKIWPSYGGAMIRLWRGVNTVSIAEAVATGLAETWALTEGVEDGLSLALADPDLRIGCAGAVGNLSKLTIAACCAELIVCKDNDWGKPQAQAQLDAGLAHLARQVPRLLIASSHVGKDVNDALRS